MAGMPELLAHRWIYRQDEGPELVLWGVAAIPKELVYRSWKRSGGLIACLACLE